MNPVAVSDDAIVQQVTIKAPAARIFVALTDPRELLQWWRINDKFQIGRAHV